MGEVGRGTFVRLFMILVALSINAICSIESACAQSKAQQRRAKSAERKIQRALDKIDAAKSTYDTKRLKLKNAVLANFDSAIAMVNASSWRIDVRTEVVGQLGEAKDLFLQDGKFEKIPAFQQTFVDYISASLAGYGDLMKAYEKAMKHVPRNDKRFGELEEEISDYRDEIHSADALQDGSVWKGYRSDFDWGPGYKVKKDENSILRLTKFRNDRVVVSFQLEVKRRLGRSIEVEISQNNKRFIAIAEGTFDGVNLNIQMTRMVKGPERYFEYSGQIAGNLGLLGLRGRKTNGALTTGKIVLESVNE